MFLPLGKIAMRFNPDMAKIKKSDNTTTEVTVTEQAVTDKAVEISQALTAGKKVILDSWQALNKLSSENRQKEIEYLSAIADTLNTLREKYSVTIDIEKLAIELETSYEKIYHLLRLVGYTKKGYSPDKDIQTAYISGTIDYRQRKYLKTAKNEKIYSTIEEIVRKRVESLEYQLTNDFKNKDKLAEQRKAVTLFIKDLAILFNNKLVDYKKDLVSAVSDFKKPEVEVTASK